MVMAQRQGSIIDYIRFCSMPTTVCTAKASCKKLPGLLELTDTHLQWTQDGKKAASIRVPHEQAASLFCSKEGAAQVRLKIGLVGDDNGHNFTFMSPQAIALPAREIFKEELTTIISRNRSTQDALHKAASKILASGPILVSASPSLAAQTPKSSTTLLHLPRAASVTSERRATPVLTGNDATSDFRLRKKVLMSNQDLGGLHRELVMSGQITEAEFWDGREHLILAQAAAESQKRGKPGQLVDPRPEAVEGGDIKIRITPQLVHDIFDEYPIVATAYSENVPTNITEEQFWKRYFQSKLFNAHRASIRSSATQHVVKDDPIFDKYLEKDDDELEPRRQRDERADVSVNLAATVEDHEGTGNEKDVTMQAGRQKAALPLIRKFNEHSERLLNSALGQALPQKRQRMDQCEDSYSQIDLDDLHDSESSTGIVLEMQDRQRYFNTLMLKEAEEAAIQKPDSVAVLTATKDKVRNTESRLTQLKIDRKAGDAALIAMTTNVANRLDGKARMNDIPDGLFRQISTCQIAANEFLRQFWLATYPPPVDPQMLSSAQRAAKAVKMIGYISKTEEKVRALVEIARQHGIDPLRVQNALGAVLQASERALTFYNSKRLAKS